MKPTPISAAQLQRLQVLYSQLCARSLDFDKSREGRMAWAAELVRRPIRSFSELTLSEGKHLIDCAMLSLGQTPNAGGWKPGPKPHKSHADRQRAGLDGRHDGHFATEEMVSAEDLDKLQSLMLQLGWSEAQLQRFLQSSRSPLRKHRVSAILTRKHANKVIFALKALARKQGVTA